MSIKPVNRDLKVKEVAEELGINLKSVRELIRKGELVAYRPGKRAFRVTREELQRFRAAQIHRLNAELLGTKEVKS